MRTLNISIALISLCAAQAAFAQDAITTTSTGSGALSGSGVTASGSIRTTAEIVESIHMLIPNRNPKKLKDVQVADVKQIAWEKSMNDIRAKRAEHRRNCRESVRRANRDQLMPTLTQCFSTDLNLDILMLRNQMQYVQAIPMLDAQVRSAATGAMLKLIDAEQTIMDAITTNLFTEQSALEETKKNLRQNYSLPVWLAMTHIRADWQLTWVVFMLKNIEERLAEPDVKGAKAQLLQDSAECMETATKKLLEARNSTDGIAASQMLKEATTLLQTCRSTLSNLARKEQLEVSGN